MNTSTTTFKTMDDLVFENRNHEYGAYKLRRKYDKHLSLALVLTISAFGLAMTTPEFFRGEEKKVESGPIVCTLGELIQPPPIAPVKPMEQIRIAPPPAPVIRNLAPVVVDRQVDEELPTNEEFIRPAVVSPNIGEGNYAYMDEVAFGDLAAEPEIDLVEKPFVVVENMPEFNGDLNKFLSKNIKYPEVAISQGIGGRVFLSFVIGKDGSISDIRVLKGISKECDEEAVRIVSKMPAWKPGKQSGRAVPVQFSLPISFQLNQ
jgi:periplasmic protein TonB